MPDHDQDYIHSDPVDDLPDGEPDKVTEPDDAAPDTDTESESDEDDSAELPG